MFIDFTDEQKALREELREYYANLITPEIHELQKQEEGSSKTSFKLNFDHLSKRLYGLFLQVQLKQTQLSHKK